MKRHDAFAAHLGLGSQLTADDGRLHVFVERSEEPGTSKTAEFMREVEAAAIDPFVRDVENLKFAVGAAAALFGTAARGGS